MSTAKAIKDLMDENEANQQLITRLTEALAVMLEIVEEEGHANSYVPQVTAAHAALAVAKERAL